MIAALPASGGSATSDTPASAAGADLPPGAVPWLHDLARWVGSWCFRPVLRVRVHHPERIPDEGPVVLVFLRGFG